MNQEHKCPIDLTVQILSHKWTVSVLLQLIEGPKRPSDLEKRLHGISAKTLSERLHQLQAFGLVDRRSHPEVPPRVVYSLTELGMGLAKPLEALRDFGLHWQAQMQAEGYDPEICSQCPNEPAASQCPSSADLGANQKGAHFHLPPPVDFEKAI